MSLQPFPIVGLVKGYKSDVKPAMLPDQAWALLENAYTFREKELKREGTQLLGRLRRVLTGLAQIDTYKALTYDVADLLVSIRVGEPQAEIQPGSVILTIGVGTPQVTIYKDIAGDGVLVWQSGTYTISEGHVNYVTGALSLSFTLAPIIVTVVVSLNYYPSIPVMGIIQREQAAINSEQTIFFDPIYAYIYNGTEFQEYIPGTTWTGSDSDFFWGFNYRGALASTRLLFVTNDVLTDPIRYTDGISWTNFAPLVDAADTLYQAKIVIAYYGRLIMLNTWEGTTAGGSASAVNYFNRCRFCQLGDPTQVDAWRSDIFGKGGFLDAPTNEAITGATFIKNTLVVDFERTTWQLRYVGEYGLPFIWERISADFGSESTFSGVLFDNYRLAVGSTAITAANGQGVDRIDLDIPSKVFDFKNANNGVLRVAGIRDYKKELVFWNYADSNTNADIVFPNKVLLYNYRNKSWAIFRDSVTAWGTFQSSTDITWDNLNVFWDSDDVTWDDSDTQSSFPIIVAGNQQGYVVCYGYPSPASPSTIAANDQETLTIQAVNLGVTPIVITSVNHNLFSNEIIYITGLNFLDTGTFLPLTTDLNDKIYQAQRIDDDTFSLLRWNFTTKAYEDNFSFLPAAATALYVGGGQIALFPKMNLLTKDINIFQGQSQQTKLSYLDFLFMPVADSAVSIDLWLDATTSGSTPGTVSGNRLVGNKKLSLNLTKGFYPPNSQYAWFKFYATLSAQYFSINVSYDDDLMNTLLTHQNSCELYAINAWCRPGGRGIFGG